MSSSSDPTETQPGDDVTRTRPSVAAARDGDDRVPSPSATLGAPRIPTSIGKYRVTGYLGKGGMGVVVAARDNELQRAVALKLLRPDAWHDTAITRIEREAQAMAKLSHPNVVTVFEINRDDEQPFIAMELVTGGTLRDWLRDGKRSWRKTLEMVIAAGRGLAAAHEAGLVHRDFKPENVLVGQEGRPRVSDFGLVASTVVATDTTPTTDGISVVAGTPAYMPPEQWKGTDLDARADQFAFAVTCWEALWGVRPFATRNDREPARLPSRRGVPRRVEVALRRALQADREKRWLKLSDLLDRLERISRDRRAAVAAGGVVTVAVVGALAFRAGGGTPESPCRAAGASLDSAWSAARLTKLRAAYAQQTDASATQIWGRTERELQSWVDEHRAVRVETCELGRSGGAGVKDIAAARDACLDRRLGLFGALVAALETPDSTTIAYARGAALGLPRSEGCRSATPSEPDVGAGSAPTREKLSESHDALARAYSLRALGKPREAIALVEPIAKSADELSWRPLIASAYLELGLDHHSNHDSDGAEKALQRSILFADASRDDDVRFQATIALSENAMQRSKFDEAGRAIESARMIASRLPDDGKREISIAVQMARLAYWRGEYRDCEARSKELVDIVDKSQGKVRLAAEIRLNLSRCLQAEGKTVEYAAPLREALAIMEETTGREHPFASDAILGLAAIEREANRPAEALRLLEEARAIRERAFGPDNPDVARVLNNIGNVYKDMGRLDEARASIEKALAIWEKAWGPDSPAVSVAAGNLGKMAMERGDFATAEAYIKRSLEIRRKTRPAGHPEITSALVRMGELYIAKRNSGALGYLREAVEANKTNEARPEKRDEAKFVLGRALFELGSDRAGGRKMMDEACKAYDAANDPFDCRAYLAKLPKP